MAYDFLKKLFGTLKDGEEPKAMTYAELEAALDADKGIQVVDLKAGGYVSKDKFDAKVTELTGVKGQLAEANTTIQSYKDMDIDGIKKSAKDWEDKYNADTQALNDKLTQQEYSHAADMYLAGYKYSSIPAKRGIRDEFDKKQFKLEDGKFLEADDFMKGLMESDDYKGAFVVEKPNGEGGDPQEGNPQGGTPPRFSMGTHSDGKPPKGGAFNFGFTGIRKHD